MLYDHRGQPIEMQTTERPGDGRSVLWQTSDRPLTDVSRDLDPADVDRILTSANQGESAEQSRLAAELEEKNWDVMQALSTRRAAVSGLEWEILPPEDDESSLAKRVAADVEEVLRTPQYDTDEFDTFHEALTFSWMGALLPGFAVTELVWGDGGRRIVGFNHVEQRHFTFRETRRPRLVTEDEPDGIELPRFKFVVHRHRSRAGAMCRGGLIRPLCWLDVFQRQAGVKDLLTFIERYGMPFLLAKVDEDSWKSERYTLMNLVKNFGPSGGGVFSKAMEMQMIQASSTTGDIYFKLLEYTGDAITKLVLGQTASSGDGGGLSGDNAQDKVRQDILESDCRQIEGTSRAQVIRAWVVLNHGEKAPIPRLVLRCEPPEDRKEEAEIVSTLSVNWDLDPDEVKAKTGYTVKPKAAPATPAPPPSKPDAVALSAESPMDAGDDVAAAALSQYLRSKGIREWFGPLQAAIEVAVEEPNGELFKEKVLALTADLPGLMDGLDSSGFEELLEKVIYTSMAQGKADRAAELAAKEEG